MTNNVVSSSLVIKLIDDATKPAGQVSDALEKITAQERRLVEQSKQIEAATKQLANLGRLDARLQRTKDGLAAEEAAVKRLSDAMSAMDKPTKKMVEALMRAEAKVQLTTEAVDQQQRKFDRAGQAFEKLAGSPFSDLTSAEERLRTRILETTEALQAQGRASAEVRESEARDLKRREAIAHTAKETLSTLGMLGGPETLHLTHEAATAGAEVQHERVEMRKSGMAPEAIGEAEGQAYKLSAKVRNVSPAQVMELNKEARSVLNNPEEVGPIVEVLTRAKSLLMASDPTGGSSAGLGMLVKGAESIGATQDPARFAKLVDGYMKAMQVMGKTINPEQIYEFDKYLKQEGARVSDRFLMTTGLSLAQELKGSTSGKDIAQTAKDIIGGFQNKHVPLKEMARVGLIDHKDIDWVGARNGKMEAKGIKAGHQGVHGADLAATDLDLWVYQVLLPALEKHGIKDQDKQLDWVSKVFNGSEGEVISKLITQRTAFENHGKQFGKATGLDGAGMNADDPTASLKGLTTQLESFAGALTSPVMASAGHVLDTIAGKLGTMTEGLHDFAEKYPKAAAVLGGGVLAGGAVAGGSLTYGLFTKLFSGSTELKGSAAMLKGSADVSLKASQALLAAAERLGGPKAAPPSSPAANDNGSAPSEADKPAKIKMPWMAAAGATLQAFSYLPDKSELKPVDRANLPKPSDELKDVTDDPFGRWMRSKLFGGHGKQETPAPDVATIAGARARGGPVDAGKTYLVGEHGPELFTASATGQITNSRALMAAMQDHGEAASPELARLVGGMVALSAHGRDGGGQAAVVRAIRAMHDDMMHGFTAVARGIGHLGEHGGTTGTATPRAPYHRPVPIAGARALGGPVDAGKTYLVGEHGPELFTPGASGAISTAQVQRMLARGSRGPRGDGDDVETAKAVRAMSFTLATSIDGIARAIEWAQRMRVGEDGIGDGGGGSGSGTGAFGYGGHGRKGFSGRMPDAELGGDSVAKFKTGKLFADKAPQVMARLKRDFGLNDVEAAAILGNLGHESRGFEAFEEDGKGGKKGPGRGWAQWTDPGRKARFFAYAQKNGLDPHSDEANYGFLRWELQHTHAGAIKALKAAGTPEEKMRAFERVFEGAGVKNYGSRMRYMEQALAAAKGHPATADADPARPAGADSGAGGAGKGSGSKAVEMAQGMRGVGSDQAARALGHEMHARAWCADFVNATLERTGGKGTGNAMARSFLAWGHHVDDSAIKSGDVLVNRGHVGFARGPAEMHNGRMMVPMIAGNHGNRVGESWEPLGKYEARRAGDVDVPVAKRGDPLEIRRRRADGSAHDGRQASLDKLHGKPIAPAVDNSHLHETVALLDHIEQRMGRIHTASAEHRKANKAAGTSHIAGLGARMRGNFSSSGTGIG